MTGLFWAVAAAALALVLVLFVGAAFAEETVGADATSMKAIAAAVTRIESPNAVPAPHSLYSVINA